MAVLNGGKEFNIEPMEKEVILDGELEIRVIIRLALEKDTF